MNISIYEVAQMKTILIDTVPVYPENVIIDSNESANHGSIHLYNCSDIMT